MILKKEILLPLMLGLIFIAFGLIMILVWFSPSRYLIRTKLKLGALLISLSLFASCSPPQPSCYEMTSLDDPVTKNDSTGSTDSVNVPDAKTEDSVKKPSGKKTSKPDASVETMDTVFPPNIEIRCYLPPFDDSL